MAFPAAVPFTLCWEADAAAVRGSGHMHSTQKSLTSGVLKLLTQHGANTWAPLTKNNSTYIGPAAKSPVPGLLALPEFSRSDVVECCC